MMSKTTELYDTIDRWARTVPESMWTRGSPPTDASAIYAVRTKTGSILVGRNTVFSARTCDRIQAEEKYGEIVAYLWVGN
jgi:hypothetical protein